MKNKIIKFINHNKLIFLFVLSLGIIITLPSFVPSYNVDAYCSMSSGYLSALKTFMKAGRLLTAFSYYLADKLNISFDMFSISSILLANVFLSLSIVNLFSYLKKYTENNFLKNILLLDACFLLFYNPLVIELLLFEEGFIMCLGIYFVVSSALNFIKCDKRHLFISFLCIMLGCICYQGILCFFIPILFMLIVFDLNGNLKKEYIKIIKKGAIAILFYGVSLIISFIIVKIVNGFVFIDGTEKLGTINIFYNIKKTIELIFSSLKGLFGFVNRPLFYITCLLLGFLTVFGNFNKKDNYYWGKVLYLSTNIVLCIVMPFVPNLAMNSAMNYTAARMIGSVCSVIGIIIIYAIIYFEITIKRNTRNCLFAIIIIYSIYNAYNFFNTSYVGLKRYKKDIFLIEKVHQKIIKYENEKDIKIKNIKYEYDSKVDYFYYEYKLTNSYNYRLYAIDWAMSCAVNIGDNHHYEYKKMTNKEKNKYFDDENYRSIDDKQFIFKEDTLYLLLY